MQSTSQSTKVQLTWCCSAQAGLIVVYANRGNTARLVAKYRPPMPVIALVVPALQQRHHKWTLRGLCGARQALIVRGKPPLLSVRRRRGSLACMQGLHKLAVEICAYLGRHLQP